MIKRNRRSVKVITAYVPLNVKHLSREQYKSYGDRLVSAVGEDRIRVYYDFPLEDCWLYKWLEKKGNLEEIKPATSVPGDRYPTPTHMVMSNIVQHQRTTWMRMASEEFPDAEVLIWLDYAILKQGVWNGKPVTEKIVNEFVNNLELTDFDCIPFPGIWDKGPISDTRDNWRFCGSTHIIPKKYIIAVDEFYRYQTKKFIDRTNTVPLDLPIWAYTELESTLPFYFYKANHDATQLTNFPIPEDLKMLEESNMTPLCHLARKYGTDKGGNHMIAGDTCHNYTPTYYELFKDRITDVKRVLEIGVNYGCSLKMWEEFFPRAQIIGLDSNSACLFNNNNRIKCFAADQNNKESLMKALNQAGDGVFDLIVDDGSHEKSHQIFSANVLLPFVAPGGYYIIEDIGIDCRPDLYEKDIKIPENYTWMPIYTGVGIGKAHCDPNCPYCHGKSGENLLVIKNNG